MVENQKHKPGEKTRKSLSYRRLQKDEEKFEDANQSEWIRD